jgi:hypothetical protein
LIGLAGALIVAVTTRNNSMAGSFEVIDDFTLSAPNAKMALHGNSFPTA